jgi:hypothetical protein
MLQLRNDGEHVSPFAIVFSKAKYDSGQTENMKYYQKITRK